MSFVLVSPSTESWFHVRAAAGRRSPHRTAGSTAASVRMTDSIVAMFGWIMPTPFAMPLTVIVTSSRRRPPRVGPGSSTVVLTTFATESVVRRAPAAASSAASSEASCGTSASRPVRNAIQRQSRADDAGREVEHLGLVDAEGVGHEPSDRGLVGVARLAGGRVRATARRDDRAGPAEPAPRVAGRGGEVRP